MAGYNSGEARDKKGMWTRLGGAIKAIKTSQKTRVSKRKKASTEWNTAGGAVAGAYIGAGFGGLVGAGGGAAIGSAVGGALGHYSAVRYNKKIDNAKAYVKDQQSKMAHPHARQVHSNLKKAIKKG